MPEVAHVQALGPLQQPVAGLRLGDVEGEVAAALEHEHRRRHLPELRPARARVGPGPDGAEVRAGQRVVADREHRWVQSILRHRVEEPEDDAGLREALRGEGAIEVGPRLDGLGRRPGHALDERAQDGAAAEREPPGTDLGSVDLGARGEPAEHGLHVGDLARAVDRDEPARFAVAAGIDREHRERAGECLGQEGQVLALAAEAVEHDDRRVAGRRRSGARLVERGGEVDAVVHPQRELLLRVGGGPAGGE